MGATPRRETDGHYETARRIFAVSGIGWPGSRLASGSTHHVFFALLFYGNKTDGSSVIFHALTRNGNDTQIVFSLRCGTGQ